MNLNTQTSTDNPTGGNAERSPSGIPAVGGSYEPSTVPDSTCPPSVIRGAKLHDAEIGIDWLRLILPYNYLQDIADKLKDDLGMYFSKPGMWGYRERYQYACGAFVTFTDKYREVCIELPGDTCHQLGNEKLLDIMTWVFEHFGRATRLDISVDFRCDDTVGLIDRVHQACMDRELCRFRKWGYIDEYGADGAPSGHSVQLGRRGKNGSGRYIRIYDKGLQTGDAERGQWERWETEFSDEVASQVCMRLIESDDWKLDACARALGAVDFRENTGSKSLDRRPIAEWWDNLLDNIKPVLVKLKRQKTTLDRYTNWLRRSVLPSLHTMAKQSGQDLQEVLRYFTGDVNLSKPMEKASAAVWEYLNELANTKPAFVMAEPWRRPGEIFPEQTPRPTFAQTTDGVCVVCHQTIKPEDQIVRYGGTNQCKCRSCVIETPEDKAKRKAREQAQRGAKENQSNKQFNLTYM
ncbi:MAG: hypothetical protein CMJ19_15200 [Phycisphaeraceae bacterium]|nr:hypothetical protein [Phycisphaeraceae bacterium]